MSTPRFSTEQVLFSLTWRSSSWPSRSEQKCACCDCPGQRSCIQKRALLMGISLHIRALPGPGWLALLRISFGGEQQREQLVCFSSSFNFLHPLSFIVQSDHHQAIITLAAAFFIDGIGHVSKKVCCLSCLAADFPNCSLSDKVITFIQGVYPFMPWNFH